MKTGIILFLALVCLTSFSSAYEEIPWQTAPLRFDHPQTCTTPEELALVRQRIAQKKEPQYSAYLELKAAAEKALEFSDYPQSDLYVPSGYQEPETAHDMGSFLYHNGQAVYACALYWTLSGEDRYADKAAEILNAWVKADPDFTGKDRGLQISSSLTTFLYSFDLLTAWDGESWGDTERQSFEAFWRKRCLQHVLDRLLRCNNWGDHAMVSILAAAIAFEDEWLARRALRRLDDYFFGHWKFRVDHRGTHLRHEVERNLGRSGITYTAYSLTAITQAFEMARSLNPDLNCWHQVTPEDATLKGAIEDFFRWNFEGVPFPWFEDPNATEPKTSTSQFNTLEVANNHFPDLDPAIKNWLSQNRPVKGGSSSPFTTLLKGDIPVIK